MEAHASNSADLCAIAETELAAGLNDQALRTVLGETRTRDALALLWSLEDVASAADLLEALTLRP